MPDVDYASVAAAALAGPIRPEELGSQLSRAWAQAYRSRLPQSSLLEFDSDGARFLFDLASGRRPTGRSDGGRLGTLPAPATAPRPGLPAGLSLTIRPRRPTARQGPHGRPCRRRHLRTEHVSAGSQAQPGDGPWRAAATVRGSGRSPTRQARSSSAACCMPTTLTSRLRSSWGCFVATGYRSSGSATATTSVGSTSRAGPVGVGCFSQRAACSSSWLHPRCAGRSERLRSSG